MKLQQFGSSLSLPDRVLTFIRDHPLMDRPVFPADGHPLLVTTDTAYRRVVAHRVTGLSGKEYDVLYLGTGTSNSQAHCPSGVHMLLSQRGSRTHTHRSPSAGIVTVLCLASCLLPRGWTPPSSCANWSHAQCPRGSGLIPRATASREYEIVSSEL